MSSDRRKYQRFAWGSPAQIEVEHDVFVDCTINNTSLGGACIHISSEVPLPPAFNVHLTPEGALVRRCHVIWRARDEVGVQFESLLPYSIPETLQGRTGRFIKRLQRLFRRMAGGRNSPSP